MSETVKVLAEHKVMQDETGKEIAGMLRRIATALNGAQLTNMEVYVADFNADPPTVIIGELNAQKRRIAAATE